MNKIYLLVLVLTTFVGCAPTCRDTDTCERQCPENTWASCTDMNLCRCESFQDVLEAGALKVMESCRDPEPLDLVISEVLIDGEPTEEEEFVELRNMTPDLIRLDGVSLHVKRGSQMRKSIGIQAGCVPPGGLILFSAGEAEPLVVPQWDMNPIYSHRRFSFSNSANFVAELRLFDHVVLDAIEVQRQLIKPGVSVSRTQGDDADGPEFLDHRRLGAGRPSSPGLCDDGSGIETGCAAIRTHCSKPVPRQLVINEVLIHADRESNEFIELVNQSDTLVDLSGITIHTVSGGLDGEKLRIWAGCLPPGESITFYATPEAVLARDGVLADLQFDVERFQFSNERTTRFELRSETHQLLDVFLCSKSQIEPAVSLNRYPDITGWMIFKHTRYFDSPSSPGLRARLTNSVPADR